MKVLETSLPGVLIIEPKVFDESADFLWKHITRNDIVRQVLTFVSSKTTSHILFMEP